MMRVLGFVYATPVFFLTVRFFSKSAKESLMKKAMITRRCSRFLNPELATEHPKRKKVNEDYRVSRIAELQERIKDITDQLGYKEKRRENASLSHNYKECDQITEQMSELKCERRKLDIELSALAKKIKMVLRKESWKIKVAPRFIFF